MKTPSLLPCFPLVVLRTLAPVMLASGTLVAQTAAPAAPDKAALKLQLDAREKRADLLLDEIRRADDRIEATVDRILETLRMVGDSQDSRTKMARLKETTIDGLQRNIGYYQQKRATLQEEMRRPTLHLTPEEKQRAIAKFDARIEKRVQQILALTKSLPTHKDYERYNVVSDGWYGTTSVRNKDFEQNRRLTAHTNSQREEVIKELQRSIEKIDRQIRSLQTELAAATTEAHRNILFDEIKKYEALMQSRRAQVAEAATPYETATRPVSNKEAQDMDAALRRAIESLRRDFGTLFQRYSAYLSERSNVNAAKAALEALK